MARPSVLAWRVGLERTPADRSVPSSGRGFGRTRVQTVNNTVGTDSMIGWGGTISTVQWENLSCIVMNRGGQKKTETHPKSIIKIIVRLRLYVLNRTNKLTVCYYLN